MARHALILGGTGQIGRAIAADLLDDGWQVTLAARGEREQPADLLAKGARLVAIDREAPGALGAALAAGADALIDTIAYTGTHAEQLLALQDDVGAFVVVSSSRVYRDAAGRNLDEAQQRGFPIFEVPIAETQPTVAPGPTTYSTRKMLIERILVDRARRPVAILRPGAIHGPHSHHPREWWFVKRMLDGRSLIPLAYEGRSRFHTTAVANIAALTVAALAHPTTCVLNIADPEAPSVEMIGTSIARHLGYRGRLLGLPTTSESPEVGVSPWSVPHPFVLDTRAAATLGYRPRTTYADAVGRVCDGLRQQDAHAWEAVFPVLASYPWPLFDYAAEDKALERATPPTR